MPGSYVQCSVCKHREPVVNHDWVDAWSKCLVHEHSHNGMTDRSADPIAGRVAPSSILKLLASLRVKWRGGVHHLRPSHEIIETAQRDIESLWEAALADPPVPSRPEIDVEAMRKNLHATFNGGHRTADTLDAFHDGMETVCSVLAAYQKGQDTNGILPADPPVGDVERRASEIRPLIVKALDEIELGLDTIEREAFIVDYAVIQRKSGGLGNVVEHSTAMHALLFPRKTLRDALSALGDVERPVGQPVTKDEETP